MHLYNLSLNPSTAPLHVLTGSFLPAKPTNTTKSTQQLVLIHTTHIQLYTLTITGTLQLLYTSPLFCIPIAARSLRLPGSSRDFVVLTSDAGRVVVLECTDDAVVRTACETYGKTGLRRGVAGVYLTVDPRGRAVMVGALQNSKLVYVMQRSKDGEGVVVSSPLEVKGANLICFDLKCVDVGFENPVFAALEVDELDDEMEKKLVYYELDLGLNHVVRKWTCKVSKSATLLITVPGGDDGPSGVLVCSEGVLGWYHIDCKPFHVTIPVRSIEDRKVVVVAYTVHKLKNTFFVLVQMDNGDVFKVDLKSDMQQVVGIEMRYFETLTIASSLVLLKSGFLFVSAESGDSRLYQVENLVGEEEQVQQVYCVRELENLVETDVVVSASPLIDAVVCNLTGEDNSQIYTLSGSGRESSMRVLRHGIELVELGRSALPFEVEGLFSLKEYIIVTGKQSTLVLSVGDSIEEVTDSLINLDSFTLRIAQLNTSIIQVTKTTLRHIQGKKVSEWYTENNDIVCCDSNSSQVVLGLTDGQIVYFELDLNGVLNEFESRVTVEGLTCLSISPKEEGRVRGRYVSVGLELSLKLLSLEPSDCLSTLSIQMLSATPSSILMIDDHIHIGLENGVLLRSTITSQRQLEDVRQRYLGSDAIRLIQLDASFLALSSTTYLNYTTKQSNHTTPLSYTPFSYAAKFHHDDNLIGVVGIVENELRVVMVERLDRKLSQLTIPLSYTPRRLLLIDKVFVVIEAQQSLLTWHSLIRIVDPSASKPSLFIDTLKDNCAALSLTSCVFESNPSVSYVVVGVVQGLQMALQKWEKASIRVYRLTEANELVLIQETEVDGIPLAMTAFQGRLLVGLGKTLRIYELGLKKLLRKCECALFPRNIVKLHTMGDRIVVCDAVESTLMATYRHFDNKIVIFADDPIPRWVTASCYIDYDTVVAGDRFGTVFVNRLDPELSLAIKEDVTGNISGLERGLIQGAPHKLTTVCAFYTGDTITSITMASLTAGARDVILYTTLKGSIGILIPFLSKSDIDFFLLLEISMRNEHISLAGRRHLSYRSSFCPVRAVVDGDLCELYMSLGSEGMRRVAEGMERDVNDVIRKLEDIRSRVAF